MNDEGRRALTNQIAENSGLQFSQAALEVLYAVVTSIDEAADNDDQLRQDATALAEDRDFYAWLARDSGGPAFLVRGVNVLHAVQDLRLNVRLARRYRIFNQVKPDTD